MTNAEVTNGTAEAALEEYEGNGLAAQESDAPQVLRQPYPTSFLTARYLTFAFMWLSYGSYYLTRNSLSFASPLMIQDPGLGVTKLMIGGLLSMQTVAYAFSKGLSGVLGTAASARVLLAGGLIATAACNVAFGSSSAYTFFALFWGLNGLLQGIGAPACARLLTNWFKGKERGTFWGLWTASNNVGGFAVPLLVGVAGKMGGWRWGFFAPGLTALAVATVALLVMKDSPEAAGFPPVEAPKKMKATSDGGEKPSVMGALQEVVNNIYVWLFALNYFFVYVVRQGITAWAVLYFMEAVKLDFATAAVRVSGLELGGLLGSLSSGAISDALIRNNTENKSGNVGLRVRVVMMYTLGTAAMLTAFKFAPPSAALQWLLVAGCGFMLYGPQMLIGLCGAETVSRAAVSSCQGFLGWVSYLGAATAGVPLALIIKKFGWNAYFGVLIGACIISFLLVVPMFNLYSDGQKNEMAEAKAA